MVNYKINDMEETKLKRGRPRIDEDLHFLNIRVTKKQDKMLHEKSRRTGIPICVMIRIAIDEYFKAELAETKKDGGWEKP